jgi:hypothetical protein
VFTSFAGGGLDRLRRRMVLLGAMSAFVLASVLLLPGWRGQALAVALAMAGVFAVMYEPPPPAN